MRKILPKVNHFYLQKQSCFSPFKRILYHQLYNGGEHRLKNTHAKKEQTTDRRELESRRDDEEKSKR